MPVSRRIERTEILLEEYKICSKRADQLSTLIWTLATALLTLSAGGLLIVSQLFGQAIKTSEQTGAGEQLAISVPKIIISTPPPQSTIITVPTFETVYTINNQQTPSNKEVDVLASLVISEVLAIASIFILFWWHRAANRWNSYITVMYRRMKEIEAHHGMNMWINRDIDILDYLKKKTDKKKTDKILPSVEEARAKILEESGIVAVYSNYSIESISKHRLELTIFITLAWFVFVLYEILYTIEFFIRNKFFSDIFKSGYILPFAAVVGFLAICYLVIRILIKVWGQLKKKRR